MYCSQIICPSVSGVASSQSTQYSNYQCIGKYIDDLAVKLVVKEQLLNRNIVGLGQSYFDRENVTDGIDTHAFWN